VPGAQLTVSAAQNGADCSKQQWATTHETMKSALQRRVDDSADNNSTAIRFSLSSLQCLLGPAQQAAQISLRELTS